MLKYIFNQCLGCEYTLTRSLTEFAEASGPKINYSLATVPDTFHIQPAGLLDSNKIDSALDPVTGFWRNEAVLFPQREGNIPFDLFSQVFYLISRYEEYESGDVDEHGRFKANASAAYKTKNLLRPWADILIQQFKAELLQKYPDLVFQPQAYSFMPTIDIDMAYCYKGKEWWRQLAAAGKDVLHFKPKQLTERIAVICGFKKDPYDVFTYMKNIHQGMHASYFFLLANYSGHDKNLPWQSSHMRNLVAEVAEYVTTGIHPSYFSSKKPELIPDEIRRLSELVNTPVIHSRQHFLRMKYHKTCLQLAAAGIRHEYSMGYAETTGFRASVARPYYFFDLTANAETSLWIHPFMLMDVTLKDYMRFNPEQACDHVSQIIKEVKQVNGELISLWHNESLSEYGAWKNWRSVYEHLIKEAKL